MPSNARNSRSFSKSRPTSILRDGMNGGGEGGTVRGVEGASMGGEVERSLASWSDDVTRCICVKLSAAAALMLSMTGASFLICWLLLLANALACWASKFVSLMSFASFTILSRLASIFSSDVVCCASSFFRRFCVSSELVVIQPVRRAIEMNSATRMLPMYQISII